MVLIFGVLKSSLLEMGISQNNKLNRYSSLAKNLVVFSILGLFSICMFTATIVIDDLRVIIPCFFVLTTCLFTITIYTYVLCNISKLLKLIEDVEVSIHKSKHSLFLIIKKKKINKFHFLKEITNPPTVEKIEDFNQSIDKWHSIAIKFPVS